DLPDLHVPEFPERRQALAVPHDVLTPRTILRILRGGQVERGRGSEVLAAVPAPALPVTGPAVAEDPVHAGPRRNFTMNRRHELEVLRSERAGDPQGRVGPMPSRIAIRRDGNPVRVRALHLVT